MSTTLSTRVLARCDADELPANHPLRVKAREFDEACVFPAGGKEATIGAARKLLGCWARLRKAWKEYSGEEIL